MTDPEAAALFTVDPVALPRHAHVPDSLPPGCARSPGTVRGMQRLLAVIALAGVASCAGEGAASPAPDGAIGGDGVPDARAPGVIVTVLEHGRPAAGVPVIFHDGDDAMTSFTTTDGDGRARGDVAARGSVTAIHLDGTLETVRGVVTNDVVLIGEPAAAAPGLPAGTYTVEATALDGASEYVALTACGRHRSATPSIEIPLRTDCTEGRGEVEVMAVAPGAWLGVVRATGVALHDGSRVVMPAAWQVPARFRATFTGIDPAQIGTIYVERHTSTGETGHASAPTTGATLAMEVPTGVATGATIRFGLLAGELAGPDQLEDVPLAGDVLEASRDLSAGLLPWIDGATFDRAARVVHVARRGGPGEDVQLQRVELRYRRGAQALAWIVYGPADLDVRLPPLPDKLASRGPQATDTIDGVSVAYVAFDGDLGRVRVRPAEAYALARGGTSGRHVRISESPRPR
jgi:hypothetical protein